MAEATFSLDLHVLGPPLTFALSQDQTLHRKFFDPALRRRIANLPGGKSRATWNGFVSQTKPIIVYNSLLSSFQRPIRPGATFSVAFRWSRRVTVEGCCL